MSLSAEIGAERCSEDRPDSHLPDVDPNAAAVVGDFKDVVLAVDTGGKFGGTRAQGPRAHDRHRFHPRKVDVPTRYLATVLVAMQTEAETLANEVIDRGDVHVVGRFG